MTPETTATLLLPWKRLGSTHDRFAWWSAHLPNGSSWTIHVDRRNPITIGYHPAGQVDGRSLYKYQELAADGQLRVPGAWVTAGTFLSATEAMLAAEQYLRSVDYQPTERRH